MLHRDSSCCVFFWLSWDESERSWETSQSMMMSKLRRNKKINNENIPQISRIICVCWERKNVFLIFFSSFDVVSPRSLWKFTSFCFGWDFEWILSGGKVVRRSSYGCAVMRQRREFFTLIFDVFFVSRRSSVIEWLLQVTKAWVKSGKIFLISTSSVKCLSFFWLTKRKIEFTGKEKKNHKKNSREMTNRSEKFHKVGVLRMEWEIPEYYDNLSLSRRSAFGVYWWVCKFILLTSTFFTIKEFFNPISWLFFHSLISFHFSSKNILFLFQKLPKRQRRHDVDSLFHFLLF